MATSACHYHHPRRTAAATATSSRQETAGPEEARKTTACVCLGTTGSGMSFCSATTGAPAMKVPNNHATKTLFALVALMAMPASFKAGESPTPETRIVFQRGATEAVVQGKLRSIDDQLRFVIRAKAKQRMKLTLEVKNLVSDGDEAPVVTVDVLYPNGDGEGPEIADDYDLPVDGDYRIVVGERNGAFQG